MSHIYPTIGKPVLGGVSGDYLKVDSSGNLDQGTITFPPALWTESSGTLSPTTTTDRVLLGGATDDGISPLQIKTDPSNNISTVFGNSSDLGVGGGFAAIRSIQNGSNDYTVLVGGMIGQSTNDLQAYFYFISPSGNYASYINQNDSTGELIITPSNSQLIINGVVVDYSNATSIDPNNRRLVISNNTVYVVDWGNQTLTDPNNFQSVDWFNRLLKDNVGSTVMADWSTAANGVLLSKVNINSGGIIGSGGSSSNFVKGDGSLDSSTYLTTASLPDWSTTFLLAGA